MFREIGVRCVHKLKPNVIVAGLCRTTSTLVQLHAIDILRILSVLLDKHVNNDTAVSGEDRRDVEGRGWNVTVIAQ